MVPIYSKVNEHKLTILRIIFKKSYILLSLCTITLLDIFQTFIRKIASTLYKRLLYIFISIPMPSNIPLPNKVEHMLMKISSTFPLDISNTHINIIFCHTLLYHISHFHTYTLNTIKIFQNILLLP